MTKFGELYQYIALAGALAGIAGVCLWLVLNKAWSSGRDVLRKCRRLSPVTLLLVIVAVGYVFEVGGTKTNRQNSAGGPR